MTDTKSRSKADDRKIASASHPSSGRPHDSANAPTKRASKSRQSDSKLCGMNEVGEPLPAGLSGMPGPSKGQTQPVEGIERRIGEVNVRVAEQGANRSGTAAAAAPTKKSRARSPLSASRKIDSEG